MNTKEIKEMLTLMKENDISEFEMEKDGFKIRLKKGMFSAAQGDAIIMQQPVHYKEISAVPQPAKDAATAPAVPKDDENIMVVKSPMVGTFYKAPAPDAAPFVAVGKQIEIGDTLCIIEAMKLMNEIKSEMRGTIVEVLIENGQAVEFDMPLFKIKK